MNLYGYLVRLETIRRSRQEIDVELLDVTLLAPSAQFKYEVRFYDGSRLSILERIKQVGKRTIERSHYKNHYQDAEGKMVFRYDNAPHHPHLPTAPSHKHLAGSVIEAPPPDLNDVLAEIDATIYQPSHECSGP
jgi:hypothetical protein